MNQPKLIEERELDRANILDKCDNYYLWQYRLVEPYIGKKILEVGCANGLMTKNLLDRGDVVALDVVPEYVEIVQQRFKGSDCFKTVLADISRSDLSLPTDSFDTVVCFNVLEHLEKDELALQNILKLLAPGGKGLFIVPAFMFLYGTMDEKCLHFRRYRRKELVEKIRQAGYTVKRARYFNLLGALGWYLNFKILKKRLLSETQSGIFDALAPWLEKWERVVNPPFGQSLLVIAEKQGDKV